MERDRERAMLTMCVRRRTRRGWHALDDGTPGPSVPTCPSCPRLACDSRRPSLSGGGRAGTPTRSVAPDATLQRPRAGRRAPRAPATHGRGTEGEVRRRPTSARHPAVRGGRRAEARALSGGDDSNAYPGAESIVGAENEEHAKVRAEVCRARRQGGGGASAAVQRRRLAIEAVRPWRLRA